MAQKYPVFPRALLPHAPGLQLMDVALTAHELSLELAATCASMPCPLCAQPSARIHSHYRRSVADLPWAGRMVRITLAVRKFFCTTRTCPRRIFTERLPTVVAPYARKTLRLTDVHRLIAFSKQPCMQALLQPGVIVTDANDGSAHHVVLSRPAGGRSPAGGVWDELLPGSDMLSGPAAQGRAAAPCVRPR
jgi:hypothetical protein